MNNSGLLVKRYMARLGIILSNFAIVSFILMIGSFFAVIFKTLLVFFLIIFALALLGIPLLSPEYRGMIKGEGTLNAILDFFASNWQFFGIICALLTIVSLLFLLCDLKWPRAKNRLKFYLTLIIVGVVILVLCLAFGIISVPKGGI